MMKKVLLLTAMLAGAVGFAQSTYDNGPLSTGKMSSTGVEAPEGYTWSEVQEGNSSPGFNASYAFWIPDDFTIPEDEKWGNHFC